MRTPDDLRVEARSLIAACRTTFDRTRKKRYAERAFKLAQLAERLSRKDTPAKTPVRQWRTDGKAGRRGEEWRAA